MFFTSLQNLINLYGLELALVALLYLVIKIYWILSEVIVSQGTVCATAVDGGLLMLASWGFVGGPKE